MRHQQLIEQLTLEEKASFCSGSDYWHTQKIERLDIPEVLLSDGPHGIRNSVGEKKKDITGVLSGLKGIPAICYPTAATTACSWDPDLLYEMGALLGEECLKEKIGVLLGPGMNMKRSPLCGRNFEYFSEDPFLAGNLAAAMINGVQSKGIGTSLKHYAVNSQETRRMTISAVVDERALREIYLSGFEIAVKKAQPWTVMCMYNRLNGIYGAENKWLLTDMLRKEFGFEGMVVTDWGAENDRVQGLLAGQNLEMPTSNGEGNRQILEAVKNGKITLQQLDESVDDVLDVAMKAKKVMGGEYTFDAYDHHMASAKIASQSMVLLKNEDKLLPLSMDSSVAVIGQMAKKPRYQGAGSSLVNAIKVDSTFDRLQLKGLRCTYAAGYALSKKEKKIPMEKYIQQAVETAREAEVALVFIGLTDEFESEGFDRKHLRIPPEHIALLSAVSCVNRNTVVVLAGGSVVEMPWANQAKAILHSYLGGEGTGIAIADLLVGDVNPSGKLAETYPYSLEDTPCRHYFPGNTATVEYRESIFIGYRYYDTAKKEVAFPFGFGLSYTDFSYKDLKLSSKKIKAGTPLKLSFTVENIGSCDGAEIAQVYVHKPDSKIVRAEQELKGFSKKMVRKGEKVLYEIELDARAFAFYDTDNAKWSVESGAYEIRVGASSRDIRLKAMLQVESDDVVKAQTELTHYLCADVQRVPDSEFAAVLGHEIPESEIHDYPNLTLANTLEDAGQGRNGKKICSLLKALIGEESMACAIALQTPLKDFVSMSMGVFDTRSADKLLDVLNDKTTMTPGLIKLLVQVLPSVVTGLPNLLKNI